MRERRGPSRKGQHKKHMGTTCVRRQKDRERRQESNTDHIGDVLRDEVYPQPLRSQSGVRLAGVATWLDPQRGALVGTRPSASADASRSGTLGMLQLSSEAIFPYSCCGKRVVSRLPTRRCRVCHHRATEGSGLPPRSRPCKWRTRNLQRCHSALRISSPQPHSHRSYPTHPAQLRAPMHSTALARREHAQGSHLSLRGADGVLAPVVHARAPRNVL